MHETVKNFYEKNKDTDYKHQYEIDHGPRLDWFVENFLSDENSVANKSIADFGGGYGWLGKRLPKGFKDYTVYEGADIPIEERLQNVNYVNLDLELVDKSVIITNHHMSFCFETLEHVTNPYNALVNIKKRTVEYGDIYISIPHANVTHNYIYPSLMMDPKSFEIFLVQMALPIISYKLWDKGWNAHHWHLKNAPWTESRMLYPKNESKFYGKTPLEYVNL